MTVDRYILPSGRIATLDTRQPSAAVEESRRTLVEGFGAVLEQEEGPAAGATADGPEFPVTPSHEENQNMTSIPEPIEIRESIRAWAKQYAAETDAAVARVVSDPEFQEWASDAIRLRPENTIDKLARRWVDENELVAVPWPSDVTPAGWNLDVGSNLGGEVSVSLDVELEGEHPGVGASVGVLVAVVVDDDTARTRLEPGLTVGDYFVSMATISYTGVEQTSDADPVRMRALADVLQRASEVVPAVAEFARALGGSERSMVFPVGALGGAS